MVGARSSVNTTTENTVDFINNQLQSGFIKIANAASVDIGLLTSDRKRISESLGIWLEEQSLGCVDLEFVTPNETVLESYRFDVTYDGDMGYVEFDAQQVIREVGDYSHRDDVIARVVPGTYRDATDLGWDTRDRPPAETESITNFGAGNIEVDSQRVLNPNRDQKSSSLVEDILREFFD